MTLTAKQQFWIRTAIEIVLGYFFLLPLVFNLLDTLVSTGPHFWDFLSAPWWMPMMAVFGVFMEAEKWSPFLYFFLAAFFLLHTIFARTRFPRLFAFFRKARLVVLVVFLGAVVAWISSGMPV